MRRWIPLFILVGVFIAANFCLSPAFGLDEKARRVPKPRPAAISTSALIVRAMDTDRNGRVSLDEYKRFFVEADVNKDGYLTEVEIKRLVAIRRRTTPGPSLGQDAPDFTLKTLDGKGTVTLSDFKHKKPVVLVFGSYT